MVDHNNLVVLGNIVIMESFFCNFLAKCKNNLLLAAKLGFRDLGLDYGQGTYPTPFISRGCNNFKLDGWSNDLFKWSTINTLFGTTILQFFF